MVEVALGSLLLAVFVTIFGGYYETAINKIIDLATIGIIKFLGALQKIKPDQLDQPEEPKKPVGRPPKGKTI